MYKVQNGNQHYTGYTNNLSRRLKNHNSPSNDTSHFTYGKYVWAFSCFIGPIEGAEDLAARLEKQAKRIRGPSSYQAHVARMSQLADTVGVPIVVEEEVTSPRQHPWWGD